MSEAEPQSTASGAANDTAPAEEGAASATKKGGSVVLLVIVVSIPRSILDGAFLPIPFFGHRLSRRAILVNIVVH